MERRIDRSGSQMPPDEKAFQIEIAEASGIPCVVGEMIAALHSSSKSLKTAHASAVKSQKQTAAAKVATC